MTIRAFDLNIEEVLENWEVEHAVREIIANALDEQLLSATDEIQILKDARGDWRVRDYGRGLRIEHFTLNEDKEKLGSSLPIIGKFGCWSQRRSRHIPQKGDRRLDSISPWDVSTQRGIKARLRPNYNLACRV